MLMGLGIIWGSYSTGDSDSVSLGRAEDLQFWQAHKLLVTLVGYGHAWSSKDMQKFISHVKSRARKLRVGEAAPYVTPFTFPFHHFPSVAFFLLVRDVTSIFQAAGWEKWDGNRSIGNIERHEHLSRMGFRIMKFQMYPIG